METCAVPQPHAGQLLLRTLYLSLDPYVRGRTSAAPSYAARMALEDVMVSGTVSRVQESRHDSFEVGDLVLGCAGWQDYALSDGKGLKVLDRHEPHPSRALGVLGMTGFTGTPPGEVS
jgi:NADPH-dependent curcumin reductase CurA